MIALEGGQELLTLLIVLTAAAWLVRRWWRRRGKASACEHCPAAAAGTPPCQSPPADTLITIGPGPDRGPARPAPDHRR